ncbi:6-phospho-beta-glucosidase [Clostridium tarantellae]|uniref:6-phospho-beta-glucosidase n=1 Tax=Clostridium tarantellae TaxID=39493 RepID=A0A6I1MP98_9CLOT|nr:6-phospho-beta-glucosidase [Clostridium tarantellae]MPQ44894.1 6-phospho-beta-glucosidase [Clostridium tarantellae]
MTDVKKSVKIVTIGGGSSYTPELVEGFIKRYNELPIKELWLVDIEEGKEKLNIVGNLAKRMVKKAGIDMKIHLTLDRREALKDADFVTTQFRVGQLKARIKDEGIPLSKGLIGQETNGAGGLFKALRTVPVVLDIVKDIQELCPNAWLINFTNPAGIVTEAVFRYTNFKRYIGLCNVPIGMKNGIADAFKVDKERITMDFAGLNHMVYGLNVYLDGQKVTEEAIEKFINSSITMKNIKDIPFNGDFVRSLGVIPCPYHKYYYKTKEMLVEELEAFKDGKTRGEVVKALEDDLFTIYKDENLDIKPPQLEKRGGAYYSDAACNLINSIYNDRKDIQVVNTLNNGAIRDFEDNDTVEVSCVITKEGPRPLTMGHLPIAVRGLIQQIKSFEILAAKAAVKGDYNSALQALVINPLIPSDDLAKEILDEMMEAHKDYLPLFRK